MKRILSLLIVLAMVLSSLPASVFATEAITVYLDPINGSNENPGTEAAPVQDFPGAYALLQKSGGTIVLLGDVIYTAVTTLPACEYPVTITSKSGAEGIKSNSHIKIAGETTFQHVSFTLTKQSTGTCISGNGHKLTMGEGITSIPYNDEYHFCLIGGDYSEAVDNTDLTVKSGKYRYTYAGGYMGKVLKNAKLTMTGGVSANLAATRTGAISGNVDMSFSGSANVTGAIYAGAATSGTISGDVTITISQNASFKSLYTGSNGSGKITGKITVIQEDHTGSYTTLKGTGGSSMSGTIGGSRLVLKSGAITQAATAFDSVDIDIPEGKVLTLHRSMTVDNLTGDGTLCFAGAVSLTAKAVTGTVHCAVTGDVLNNQVYVTAPAGSDIIFPSDTGISEENGVWLKQDLEDFSGLVLKAASAVKMNLYTGIWNRGSDSQYTLVTPYATETKDGYNYYYYPNAQGSYHVRASQSGYITLYKDIYQSPEEAATKTVETITLDKKSADGFAPSTVYSHTTEVLENEEAWKSDASMYPKYEPYLQNPIFQEGRNPQQMTTQEEMEAFIASLDQENDNMYVFSLGKSDQYGYNIPAVIFTESDLSSATTLEEAATLLDNRRVNIFYRAQIHGNEPAGGEGALAMIYYLQHGYAENILDEINLVVIPRLSPDGSYLYQRPLLNSSHTCDHLLLETGEVQALQRAYLAFRPEIVLDGHERVWNNQSGDIQVSTAFTPMNSDDWQDTALAMDQAAFTELETNELCGYYYSGAVNGYNPNMANAYFTTAGSLYVLMETRGIYGGNEAIERRVVAHMAAVEGILNYLHDNAGQVKAMVTAEREMFAQNGATYDAEDQILLETASRTTTAADRENWGNLHTDRQTIDWATGEVTFNSRYPSVYDVVKRSRTAPTAYVIPSDANNIDEILLQLTRHGIGYTKLPAGTTLYLQHYSGTTTEATLSPENLTRFRNGCYVFTMNHEKALVLATLMEPDITNAQEHNGTLAQRGLLSISDTYRYIRDLNTDGFVDYTITEGELTTITVYLDGTNGADTNDGLTEATAVKTLKQAYSLMDTALSGAEEGSQGNLTIIGMYDLGAQQSKLPAASYPVNITGKTSADGFLYTGGSSQATRTFEIQGPTTFRNMTIHINNTEKFNFFLGNGHKLVIDEGVNFTTNKANCYFTLAGGDYDYNDVTASTDITIRSGKWRTIYAGGYRASVTGKAKADISGVWVYNNIAVTYCGNIGEAEMSISDTELVTNNPSFIYAGSIEYSDTRNQGAILGDTTVILGKNITGLGAYTSSCLKGDIKGTATIIAAGVDLSQFPVYALRPGTTGSTAVALLRLGEHVTQDVTLDAALPLDLNGYDITGNLTVDGTLTVYDSATDDYTVADGRCGEITGMVTGTLAAKEGYVAAANGFHKFDQCISSVSLRPQNAGIYYSASFLGDEVLLSQLEVGVAVSLVDMPGNDLETDEDTRYAFGKHGILVQNILTGSTDDADRAIMDIYAASFAKLPDGTVLVSETEVAYSLFDVLMLIKAQNPAAYESFVKQYQQMQ